MAITDFHLLLLESDPGRRETLLQAARQSGLKSITALSDLPETRRYLDGRTPSLLLFDLDAPSGLDLLALVRSRSDLRGIVTVGLIDRRDGQALGPAYDLHINSCLVRPDGAEEQVALFRSLRQYWEGLNQASGF